MTQKQLTNFHEIWWESREWCIKSAFYAVEDKQIITQYLCFAIIISPQLQGSPLQYHPEKPASAEARDRWRGHCCCGWGVRYLQPGLPGTVRGNTCINVMSSIMLSDQCDIVIQTNIPVFYCWSTIWSAYSTCQYDTHWELLISFLCLWCNQTVQCLCVRETNPSLGFVR